LKIKQQKLESLKVAWLMANFLSQPNPSSKCRASWLNMKKSSKIKPSSNRKKQIKR